MLPLTPGGYGKRMELSGSAPLKAGENVIEVAGGDFALDVDFLEVTAAAK